MGKESTCSTGDAVDMGLIPGLGKIPWRRAWQPTPLFLNLENPMDRGAWPATILRVAKSQA